MMSRSKSKDNQVLVDLQGVSKRFRLQRDRPRSLQEAFIRFFWRQRSDIEYFWPLRDISFQVKRGESIGILGQNGSGKSTLLKVVTGVLQPTSGQVGLYGVVAALLELGTGFHPELTGRENIYLNGSIMGMDRREINRKLDSIIEFAELGDFIDTPVKHFSSGMYVRLGFSVAIHMEPELLVVDEVLAVGDLGFQQKCMERIRALRGNGVALLLVSHGLGDVERLCDRAIWLEHGVVRADGAAAEVVDQYVAFTNDQHYRRKETERNNQQEAPIKLSTKRLPHAARWGTHQAEIANVELLNTDDTAQDFFSPGDSLKVRMHYVAHERVTAPAFGLALYRSDGVHVNGPNSVREKYPIPAIQGTGYVDYILDTLLLAPGSYELTVAIYNRDSTVALDHQHRAYGLEVRVSSGRSEEGLVHLPARWFHCSANHHEQTTRNVDHTKLERPTLPVNVP